MTNNMTRTTSIVLRRDDVCVTLIPWHLRVEVERDGIIDVLVSATSPDRRAYDIAQDVMATAPASEAVERYLRTWHTDREHAVHDALDPWRSSAALASANATRWPHTKSAIAWPDRDTMTLERMADASALAIELLGDASQPSPTHVTACTTLLGANPNVTAREIRATADKILPTITDDKLKLTSFLRLVLREDADWLKTKIT